MYRGCLQGQRGQKCGLTTDVNCTRTSGCPVFPIQKTLPAGLRAELDRRILVVSGASAAIAGLFALILGGFTAVIGRVMGGTTSPQATPANPPTLSPSSPVPGTKAAPAAASGTAVGTASSVPVGRGLSVTNPADGSPAWVVHTSGSTFVSVLRNLHSCGLNRPVRRA